MAKEIKQVKYAGLLVDAKVCTKCKKLIPLKFYTGAGKGYLKSSCKFCENELEKIRRSRTRTN